MASSRPSLHQRTAAVVRAQIIERCRAGLDSYTLRQAVMDRLRVLIPLDSYWFATADPETLLITGALVEEIPESVTPLFMANEFLQDDVNKWVQLALERPAVSSLAAATCGRLMASARYREILEPLGFGDELRAVLHDGHSSWGFMCVHRERSGLAFSSEEAEFLAALAPHLAEGLRAALLLSHVPSAAIGGPGLLLLTDDFSLVAATPAGQAWLDDIPEPLGRKELPQVVLAVTGRLFAEEGAGRGVYLPRARVRTRSGEWLIVHASRLRGAEAVAPIAVILEPARPMDIAPLLLEAYGLTKREAQIARLVLRGIATAGIAIELSISEATVQQHLKSIFDKTGVGSRRQLVASIVAGAHSSRLDQINPRPRL